MLYLDTSILVAALTNEARSAGMQTWLARQVPDELFISDWVVTEFSGALSIKLRTAQLEHGHRADALAMFNTLIENSLSVLAVEREDFDTAARFVDQHTTGLRSGDALHLAVAARHGARLHALDTVLIKAADVLGVSARLL